MKGAILLGLCFVAVVALFYYWVVVGQPALSLQ